MRVATILLSPDLCPCAAVGTRELRVYLRMQI
jgi:hypothetical protein